MKHQEAGLNAGYLIKRVTQNQVTQVMRNMILRHSECAVFDKGFVVKAQHHRVIVTRVKRAAEAVFVCLHILGAHNKGVGRRMQSVKIRLGFTACKAHEAGISADFFNIVCDGIECVFADTLVHQDLRQG